MEGKFRLAESGHLDLAWTYVERGSRSSSVVEDSLAAAVGAGSNTYRLRADVIHIGHGRATD